MQVVARAPGKAVLFGEYAVLEGAPALVAALDVAAEAHYAEGPEQGLYRVCAPQLGLEVDFEVAGAALEARGTLPPALELMAIVLQDGYAQGALPPGTLTVDTRAFFHGGHKLGLGSSAAAAVAAWHALRAAAGEPSPPGALATVAALHRRAQSGSGSGVDVAASTLGGVVRYQLPDLPGSHGAAGQVACRLQGANSPVLVPVVAGEGSATAPFLRAFAALKGRDPHAYWRLLEPLAQLSAGACELWALGEVRALLPLVDAYAAAMQRLGEAMDMPVVSPEHERLGKLARSVGAAYKPTGAGGGDVGLGFCSDAGTATKLRRLWRQNGHTPLNCAVAPGGVTTKILSAKTSI